MRVLKAILDFLFPARCLACGERGSAFCPECLAACPPAERECPEWIFPALDYRHPPVKKSLWLLKYESRKNLAGIFASLLHGKIMEEMSELLVLKDFREPFLIPIPLSPKRNRERGYNQAELICRELVKLNTEENLLHGANRVTGRNFKLELKTLIKTRETQRQTTIRDRRKRLRNLADSFTVREPKRIKGRNIILIDDIITTGATLAEARRVLRRAGARQVIAFTVAH